MKFFTCLALYKALILLMITSAYAAHDGAMLYQEHCSVCHNDRGMGGIGLPLTEEKISYLPNDYIFKTIRYGRPGRVMPAFETLSDSQINSIVDYLNTWCKDKSLAQVDDSEVIDGNAKNGKQIYLSRCSKCHGETGESVSVGTGVTQSRERDFAVIPPALNNKGFLKSASDHWIKKNIVMGRKGTIMPSFEGELQDQEINDVVKYIRSFERQHANNVSKDSVQEASVIIESPYDFETTVDNVKNSLSGMNFRYFPDRYFDQGLVPEGEENKKALTIRFCNFNNLYQMLKMDPRVGIVLPCRISVVERKDGTVELIAMNMEQISRLFNNSQLEKNAQKMYETVMEVIEEATL